MKYMLGTFIICTLLSGMSLMTGGRFNNEPARAMESPVDLHTVQAFVLSMDCDNEYIIIIQDNRYVRFRIDREMCINYKKFNSCQVRILYSKYRNGQLEINEMSPVADTGK